VRRFFAAEWQGELAILRGDEAHHAARVLRLGAGDEILLAREGEECVCRIEASSREEVRARVLLSRPAPGEPRRDIRLLLACMKADKMEWAAQKATELGASAFVPFVSSRCVKVPQGEAALRAQARLCRICFEALKQCGRTRPVEVRPPLSWQQLLCEVAGGGRRTLLAYEASDASLKEALAGVGRQEKIDLIVGPEGGFAGEEARQLCEAGARPVSLGRRILRGETAAIALLAIAGYETEC